MKSKAFVFDFDDTLATTDAMVIVGEQEMTPQEYNAYILKDGEHFDFSQFKNPERIANAIPMELMSLAQTLQAEGHPLFILTARNNCVSDAIAAFLETHGITCKAVHCVGSDTANIAKEKRTVLLSIIENYDTVYFYDDDEKNVSLASEISGIKAIKVD